MKTRQLLSWDNGKGANTSDTEDGHGNINAREGMDRCQCGCKYWEDDRCIDCGTLIEIVKIRQLANQARFMNEVKLNVLLATMTHYDLPWVEFPPITGLEVITDKYRRLGVIQ